MNFVSYAKYCPVAASSRGSRRASQERRRLALAEELHSSALRLLRRLRGTDRDTGLGPARLSALSVLVFGGPRRLGELARIEGVRAPTMTRIVQGLEEEGLVRRTRATDDRRVKRLAATRRGVAVLERGRRARVETLAGLLTNLQRRDLDRLREAARLLRAILSERYPETEAGD